MRRQTLSAVLGLLLCLLAGLSLASCATTRGSTLRTVVAAETAQPQKQSAPSKPAEKPKPTATKGIEVVTDPDTAEVWIDGHFKGLSPLVVDDASQGVHRIIVRKAGYYDSSTWIEFSSEYMLFQVNLVPIVGFLDLAVSPAESVASLNGDSVSKGLTQLPVGSYTLKVRSFGYTDYETTVVVEENAVTTATVTLAPAAFAVTSFSAPKTAVNPDNPGLLGTLDGYFSVTAPGQGRIDVVDAAGETVYSQDLPDFTSWDGSFNWDVVDDAGRKLPDGVYTMSLVAAGRDGSQPPAREISLRVDRTLKIAARSVWSGGSGLLYAPVAEVLPPGDFQVGIMGAGIALPDLSVFQAPVMIASRVGLEGKLEIDASLGLIAVPSNLPVLASLAARWNLVSPTGEFGTSAAIQAKIALQFIPAIASPLMTDTFANFTGLSVEIPLQLSLGQANLLLTAGATASLWYPYRYNADASPQQSFATWLYLRAGVLFDLGSVTAGVSGSTRTDPLPGGISRLGTSIPFELGAEVHWLIPGTRLLLSGIMAGEYEDASNYYFMGGMGLGFLY